MDYNQFVSTVASEARLPNGQAESLAHATLQTLGDRLSGGEAGDLAARLPGPLQQSLRRPRDKTAEGFGLEEFLSRVRQRCDVDGDRTADGVRATFAMVRQCVSRDELEDMMSELPNEYQSIVQRTQRR